MGWLVALVAVALIGVVAYTEVRAMPMIYRWAEERGYAVSEVRRRWLFHGAFWWVYDVQFFLPDGSYRDAEVRVGHWLLGAFVGRVAVEWIDA